MATLGPERFGQPWRYYGRHDGHHISLCPPGNGRAYWIAALHGECSTSGDSEEEAVFNAKVLASTHARLPL